VPATARKLKVVEYVAKNNSIRKNGVRGGAVENPLSKAHAIRKIADVLLREHPEGLKTYTLQKIAQLKLGITLEKSYVINSLIGFDYFIDCKESLIFKP
jgi:hypothetical protein